MWAAVGRECAGQDVVRPGMGQAGARQRRDGARRRASLPAVGAQWRRPAGGAAGGKQTEGGGEPRGYGVAQWRGVKASSGTGVGGRWQ